MQVLVLFILNGKSTPKNSSNVSEPERIEVSCLSVKNARLKRNVQELDNIIQRMEIDPSTLSNTGLIYGILFTTRLICYYSNGRRVLALG